MRRAGLITRVFVATLLATGTVAADADTPYLATIAIERTPGAHGKLGSPVLSTLHVNDPGMTAGSLSQLDGLDVVATGTDTVRIRFDARPTFRDRPGREQLQSSWVVDYDEPVIQELVQRLAARYGKTPTPAELERFVFEHVHDKSYSRSFDLASRVAATGAGDCTEHAVLLAAVARATGHAARVVLGNLILERSDGLLAFGHAWTEIHDGEAWQIRDGTLPDDTSGSWQVRYIPLGRLTDEGPSYFLSLVQAMSAMPVRISEVSSP
ncbi:MAG: transglutaminase domain-containing protein [Woeseiaceae bacterium]